jgi:hypothetical protein
MKKNVNIFLYLLKLSKRFCKKNYIKKSKFKRYKNVMINWKKNKKILE